MVLRRRSEAIGFVVIEFRKSSARNGDSVRIYFFFLFDQIDERQEIKSRQRQRSIFFALIINLCVARPRDTDCVGVFRRHANV